MVDAVNNNNRNTAYAAVGTAAGLAAGAGYGAWLSKPLLKDDAPSDAFVRRVHDNTARANVAKAGENAKKALTEADAYKQADNLDKIKAVVTEQAEKLGLKPEVDADGKETKSLAKVVEEYIGSETDVAKVKSKMEKTVVEVAEKAANDGVKDGKKLQSLAKAAADLADNADEAARKSFVSNNAEILGIKADGIDEAAKKTVTELKSMADDITKPLATAKATILEHFDVKDGMKKLADNADDATKAAFEAVKKGARDTKLWAGAKWAGIAGAAVGIASYVGAKLSAPKAPVEEEQA